nr:2321_t:CDS:10 [Entrophospora candida]
MITTNYSNYCLAKIKSSFNCNSSEEKELNNNVVGLNGKLWNELCSLISENEKDQFSTLKPYFLISVTPLNSKLKSPLEQSLLKQKTPFSKLLPSIVVYGKLNHLDNSKVGQEDDNICCVSSKFLKQNNLQDDIKVEIRITHPIELEQVILGAMNLESYSFSIRDPSSLSKCLTSPSSTPPIIFRYSQIYNFSPKSSSSSTTAELHNNDYYSFKVLMCDPVLQDNFIETQLSLLKVNGSDQLNAFTPIALSSPISSTLLQPQPSEKEDSNSRVLIGLKELVKLGFQSGRWALVSGPDFKKSRMCQVYSMDIPQSLDLPHPAAYISPLFWFNLGFEDLTSTKTLYIQPAISPQLPPSIARDMVVSRVPSPHSIDRSINVASLDGLKRWFEEFDRIVCEGDIIAIPIDEEAARLRPQKIEGDIELLENIKISTLSVKPNTIVYFKISNLQLNHKNKKKCLMYGYGRRVDTSLTKLLQTGMEHSRVPSMMKQYLGIKSETPMFPGTNSVLTSQGTSYNKLFELVSSCLHPKAISLNLSCTVLLHGPRGCGKKTIVEWAAERVGVHVYEVNCFEIAGESDTKTETLLRTRIEKAITCSPCILLLCHIDALARKNAMLETGQEPTISTILQDCFRQLTESFHLIGFPVLVVATTVDIEKVPDSVIGCFRHEIQIEAPSEPVRLAILKQLTSDTPLGPDVSLTSLATQTAALVAKDLVDLVARAGLASIERVEKALKKTNQTVQETDIAQAIVALTSVDFESALNKVRTSYSDSIGAPKIPNVTWDDVGGLVSVKNDILDTIQLPLEHPELFASGMKKRSGVLLYGPPGTGKTLLAKAVATSCSLNFFSVKGPELLNMYIGESEANVRRVFQRARDAKPCVIFFDELDSVAPKRGEKGDSGGVMDRIVSQLLAELDGMGQGSESADVFVIGATNRPDLLDPALLRPGRFDKLLYLGVSQDHETQLKIIEALSRKFRLHPSLDLRTVAKRCPFTYTGADFYALCSDAMLKAMSRTAEAIETKVAKLNENPKPNLPNPMTSQYYLNHLATAEDTLVEVTQEDFDKALKELIPSVSEKELEHYRMVQMKFAQQETQSLERINDKDGNDGGANNDVGVGKVVESGWPLSKRESTSGKIILSVKLRKLLQLNDKNIDEIWNTYKELARERNLKLLYTKILNRLLKAIRELDNNPQSRLNKFLCIYKDMKAENTNLTQIGFNYLIEALLENNDLKLARKVFDERFIFLPDLINKYTSEYYNAFNIILMGYGKSQEILLNGKIIKTAGNLQEVSKLYSLMYNIQLLPNRDTKAIMRNIFTDNIDFGASTWFCNLMERKLVDLNLTKGIMQILARRNRFDEAVIILEKMKILGIKSDPYIFFMLLANSSLQKKDKISIYLIKEMREQKIELNTLGYNILIRNYNKEKNYEKAYEMIEEMLNLNVELNLRTFNEIFHTFAKLNKVNPTFRMMELMSEKEIQPNKYIYSSMLSLLSKTKNIKMIEKIFLLMIEDGIDPNRVTYDSIIHGYGNTNKLYKSIEIYQKMINEGIKPDVQTYNGLISFFAKKDDLIGACVLFNEMYELNLTPDLYTYSSLLNVYARTSKLHYAEKILSQMKETGIQPHTATYNMLIKVYVERGNMRRVQEIIKDMLKSSIYPDKYTYSIIMNGVSIQGKMDTAVTILKHMVSNKYIEPDAHIYTVLIRGYLKINNFETAIKIFQYMINRKVKPTYVTFAVLIEGYCRIGKIEFAIELLDILISQPKSQYLDPKYDSSIIGKLDLPPHLFTPVMNAYAKKGQFKSAREIFEKMITLGIPHNSHSFTILMDAYRIGGNHEAVFKMWKVLYKKTRSIQLKLIRLSEYFNKKKPPPNFALSIMMDALSSANDYETIENEWDRLYNDGFEFDSHNYNRFAQILIKSGKIKRAC